MKNSVIAVAFATMLAIHAARGQTPAATDSAIATVVAKLVSDSLSVFRDSLAVETKRRALDSLRDVRPARKYLHGADTSLLATAPGSVSDDYPLGPGDVLVLSIWGQKQASYEIQIDRDGQILVPAAGVVNLNGASFGSAKRLIGRKLSAVYSGISSGQTQFDLTMAKLKQVRVFVVGEVRNPGAYLLPGATSVLQAVSKAGGPTERGSDRLVRIVEDGATRDIDIYRYLFLGRRPSGDVLRDGQVVRVPPAQGTAEVVGGAARPGVYEVLPGETSESLLELAGGVSAEALAGQPMNLVRRSGTGTYTVLVGPGAVALGGVSSSPVGPGDVLEVPREGAFWRTSPVIQGAVLRPGTYPWSEGLGVRKLVEIAGGTTEDAITERVLVFRDPRRPGSPIDRLSLASGGDLPIRPSDSIVVASAQDFASKERWVRIDGAVPRPGSHRWMSGMTAKDLLALAGGTLPSAMPSKARLDVPGKDDARVIDLSGDLASGQGDVVLEPFTMVGIPSDPSWRPSASVSLSGMVAQPGTLVLLSPRERVSSVVARAGGLRPEAYGGGAHLVRRTEGRVPFDLSVAIASPGSGDDVEMLDGDSLHVPWVPSTVRVQGEVNEPTAALWRKGKSWKWYVENAGGFTDSAQMSGVYVVLADGSIQTVEDGALDPPPGSKVVVPRLVPPQRANAAEKIAAFGTIASAVAALVTAWAIFMTVDN